MGLIKKLKFTRLLIAGIQSTLLNEHLGIVII